MFVSLGGDGGLVMERNPEINEYNNPRARRGVGGASEAGESQEPLGEQLRLEMKYL